MAKHVDTSLPVDEFRNWESALMDVVPGRHVADTTIHKSHSPEPITHPRTPTGLPKVPWHVRLYFPRYRRNSRGTK